ncbi:Putative antitoxin YfjZ [Yersinia intermedia]|uniref:Putative antitoxin YfjZ n=1 Tax=Yersinia intermedia TaxID=631 RepID=A0A0H5LUV1_YERIN|nr:Putative antitoxin YfjZ [Yersinia intermedia]
MSFTSPHEWGLQSDITPRSGARLVQDGNRLHYLADSAGLTGSFSPAHLQKLGLASRYLLNNCKICCVSVS